MGIIGVLVELKVFFPFLLIGSAILVGKLVTSYRSLTKDREKSPLYCPSKLLCDSPQMDTSIKGEQSGRLIHSYQ